MTADLGGWYPKDLTGPAAVSYGLHTDTPPQWTLCVRGPSLLFAHER